MRVRKFFIYAFLAIGLSAVLINTARADDPASVGGSVFGSFSGSSSGVGILGFFGISGFSCMAPPQQSSCDSDPKNGLFNAIACQVMNSVNGSVVAASRIARAKPAISAAVSPRAASAPSSAANSISLASPARIPRISAEASSCISVVRASSIWRSSEVMGIGCFKANKAGPLGSFRVCLGHFAEVRCGATSCKGAAANYS